MGVLDNIKATFKSGNMLVKLIYINVAVFLTVALSGVVISLFQISTVYSLGYWLAIPADIKLLIPKIWTVITYMFTHEKFWHIAFNMVVFFIFGRIFLSYFDGKKLLSVYIVGGIFGALLYLLFYNLFPFFQSVLPISVMVGASASVMAILVATAVYAPNSEIHLIIIGPVKLKHIAIFFVVLDLISITSENAGGHIAHLGGAILGYLYIRQYKKGKNFNRGFDRFMDNIAALFKPRKTKKFKVTYKKPVDDMEYNREKTKKQKDVDQILDKISKYGYDKLTKEEKETLFKMGNKNK